MKRAFVFLAALFVIALASCYKERLPCKIMKENDRDTISRFLEPFDKISIQVEANVYIRFNPAYGIRIEGPSNVVEFIESEFRNQRIMTIYTRRCLNGDEPIDIYLNTGSVKFLELFDKGHVEMMDTFIENVSEIFLRGEGDIIFRSHLDSLIVNNTADGSITVHGDANYELMEIHNKGPINAFGLKTRRVQINQLAFGKMETTVTDTLEAIIYGSGNIYYAGDPSVIDITDNGSGDVIKVD